MKVVTYGTALITCRDEFIRYRIAVCDAKSKFCDAKLNVIRRKLRCEAILTAPKKNVVCMRFPCVHECMHAYADCVPVCDQRSPLYAIFFYLSRGQGTRFVLLSAYAIRSSFP